MVYNFQHSKNNSTDFFTQTSVPSTGSQIWSDLIPVNDNHTHLGVTFSKDLRFQQHVKTICRKVNTALSPLYTIAKHIPRTILDQIYKTYIRPHFDYCDTIYDGHITVQDSMKLETLQNRTARLVTGGLYRTHTNDLLCELGWEKLKTRRQIHRLVLYHKLNTSEHHPHYVTAMIPNTRARDTDRNLRNANTHTTSTIHTSAYKRSFLPTTIEQWNELPHDTQQLSHTHFKKQLCQQLGAPDPPSYHNVGSKMDNVLHARLRMKMTRLNSHLFTIQKVNSPECFCGHRLEDIKHFVIDCQNYQSERDYLNYELSLLLKTDFDQLTSKQQLDILLYGKGLSSSDGVAVASLFQKFLRRSRRFPYL